MTKEELYRHPGWEWCTFEGARKHALLLGLQSTFREKLEWLEEAETLTLRMRAGQDNTEGRVQKSEGRLEKSESSGDEAAKRPGQ